jgi:hypothetical protein
MKGTRGQPGTGPRQAGATALALEPVRIGTDRADGLRAATTPVP